MSNFLEFIKKNNLKLIKINKLENFIELKELANKFRYFLDGIKNFKNKNIIYNIIELIDYYIESVDHNPKKTLNESSYLLFYKFLFNWSNNFNKKGFYNNLKYNFFKEKKSKNVSLFYDLIIKDDISNASDFKNYDNIDNKNNLFELKGVIKKMLIFFWDKPKTWKNYDKIYNKIIDLNYKDFDYKNDLSKKLENDNLKFLINDIDIKKNNSNIYYNKIKEKYYDLLRINNSNLFLKDKCVSNYYDNFLKYNENNFIKYDKNLKWEIEKKLNKIEENNLQKNFKKLIKNNNNLFIDHDLKNIYLNKLNNLNINLKNFKNKFLFPKLKIKVLENLKEWYNIKDTKIINLINQINSEISNLYIKNQNSEILLLLNNIFQNILYKKNITQHFIFEISINFFKKYRNIYKNFNNLKKINLNNKYFKFLNKYKKIKIYFNKYTKSINNMIDNLNNFKNRQIIISLINSYTKKYYNNDNHNHNINYFIFKNMNKNTKNIKVKVFKKFNLNVLKLNNLLPSDFSFLKIINNMIKDTLLGSNIYYKFKKSYNLDKSLQNSFISYSFNDFIHKKKIKKNFFFKKRKNKFNEINKNLNLLYKKINNYNINLNKIISNSQNIIKNWNKTINENNNNSLEDIYDDVIDWFDNDKDEWLYINKNDVLKEIDLKIDDLKIGLNKFEGNLNGIKKETNNLKKYNN